MLFQHLQKLLQNHIDHLNNIYFTLHRNGYSSLRFPNGTVFDHKILQRSDVVLGFTIATMDTSK